MIIRLCTALLLLVSAGGAGAHGGGTTGMATVTINGLTVRYTLTLTDIPPGSLADQMHLGQLGITPDYQPLIAAIEQKIRITADGSVCAASGRQLVPPSVSALSITGVVDFICPETVGRLTLRDDLPDVLGADHHTLTLVVWPGGSGQHTFDATLRDVVWSPAGGIKMAGTVSGFFMLGVAHVLMGLGHMLFLLVLILRANPWRPLLATVFALTAGQVATMALAVAGVNAIGPRLTEIVVALAVVLLSAQTLFSSRALLKNWVIGLIVGLVHGLGLSEAALDLAFAPGSQASSVLSFNLGVGAGYLGVAMLASPILMLLRRLVREQQLVMTLTTVLLAAGSYLFVKQLFFGV